MMSYVPYGASIFSRHTFGAFKYYGCLYMDILFETAGERYCDLEAIERDYYDTSFLNPDLNPHYFEIFTKENATNEKIAAVINSGNGFILKNFTTPGLMEVGGHEGMQFMIDHAPNKTYGVRNHNWFANVVDVPLKESLEAIKANREWWYIFFDNGLMHDIAKIKNEIHDMFVDMLSVFPTMARVGLSENVNSYITATFIYFGRWWKTPMHQALAAGFFIQLSNTKMWTIVPHRYQMWMRTHISQEPSVRFSEHLCLNRESKIPIMEILVEPGDLMYLPPFWMHQVVSLEDVPGIMIGLRPLGSSVKRAFLEPLFPFLIPREDFLHHQLMWASTFQTLFSKLLSLGPVTCYNKIMNWRGNDILTSSYAEEKPRKQEMIDAYGDKLDEVCKMRQEEDPSHWGYTVIQRDQYGQRIE